MEFKKEYLHVLYEQQQGNFHITLDQYKELLKNSVKFKYGKIIIEDRQLLIDIPNKLIDYLIVYKNSLIKGEDIKIFFKDSKHWSNIKNIKIDDVYFAIFNFTSDKDIDRFNYRCYNIPTDDLKTAKEYFNEYCKDLDGFYNKFNNLNVIAINDNSQTLYNTIYHELSHFIQVKGNIRIINGLTKNQVKNKNLLKILFNVDYEQVFNYFSDKEFIPHVDDLINDLFKTKKKFYNEISNFEFLEELRKFLMVKNRPEMITNKFFNNFKDANNGDYATLAMLLFAYICKFRFQQIFNIIKRRFK